MIKVVVGNTQRLSNLTNDERNRIKEDLTFSNPQYEQAIKYSRYKNVRIPKYLKMYRDGKELEVPYGYTIPFENEVISDNTLSLNVEYPPCKVIPREMQEKAMKHFIDKGTICLPTGMGKSMVGLMLAGRLKQRALVVVNTDALIEGWKKDLMLCFGLESGLVKGKVFDINHEVVLTTIQTLSRLGDEKISLLKENISMVVIDESHHASSKSYQILHSFKARYRLGLTATPLRNDGLLDLMYLICGDMVFNGTNEKSSDIIPPNKINIVRRESNVSYRENPKYYWVKSGRNVGNLDVDEKVLIKNTSLWKAEIAKLLKRGDIAQARPSVINSFKVVSSSKEFNNMLCKDIISEYNKGKSSIVFCKERAQVDYLYDCLKDKCPKLQKFYSGIGKAEVLERAESKEVLLTIATIAIATEGVNVKSWECGFLASSVANAKDLIQILGRLRRTKEGKDSIVFYDYRHPKVFLINRHGAKRDGFYKDLGINT